MQITIDGLNIELDDEGFLLDLDEWSEALAQELAEQEGLSLQEEHWAIIHALRDFYQQFELSPAMRPLVKYIGRTLGADKGNSMYLLKLFPGSPAKVCARLAGLPKPTNCM